MPTSTEAAANGLILFFRDLNGARLRSDPLDQQ